MILKNAREAQRTLLLLILAFEFSISATTTGEPIKMFSHERAFLTPGTIPLIGSDLSRLIDFVHIMCLGHYSVASSFLAFGAFRLTM